MDDIYDNPMDWEEMQNSSSMFCIGKYEILNTSIPFYDIDNDLITNKYAIQCLNGADVKFSEADLQYEIDWKEKGKSINSISFTMPRDEAKLGHIFETLPYGLIKKNRTGVGATTLELESPRNSIVVVPTKALAITKAKKSKIEGTEKYKYLYVAGDSNNLGFSSIENYLSDSDIIHKKFIVVADSLPKVLREIGEQNYPSYFFMVDEIDSYQYDSNYRDSLENVIDYYFKFPENKRCLVSATVGRFSNKKIEEEPVINVNFNEPQHRNINLLHTNNIVKTAVNKILEIRREYPDDKILIAYNTVRKGILEIIENLRKKLKEQHEEYSNEQITELLINECAVLCSTSSEPYVENYYSDIEDEYLPKKINFMTCTYFVGIDISERFHLISIADSRIPFTLLSEDKFLQIAGRCRNDDGLVSETIIFQSKQGIIQSMQMNSYVTSELVSDSELEEEIKEDALLLTGYMNAIPKIAEKFPLLSKELNETNFDKIIKNSSKIYYRTSKNRLVRKDVDNIFQPAYFKIDNIIIQYNLLNNLYASIDNLPQSLEAKGNVVIFQDIVEESIDRISEEERERIYSEIRAIEQDEIGRIIEQIRPATSLEERIRLANEIKINSNVTRKGQLFIDRFLELQKYVHFEQLVSILTELQYDNDNNYDRFFDSVIFWALSDEHPFKIAFRDKFPLNTNMTNEQIINNSNELFMSFLGLEELDTIQSARKYLNILCKNGRSRSRNRENGNPYIIRSYDINGFNATPLERIPATVEIHKEFRFLKK